MRKIAIHDALLDYYKIKNEVKSEEEIQEIFNDIMVSLPNVVVSYKLSKEDLEKYEATDYLKATNPTFSEKNVDLKKFAMGVPFIKDGTDTITFDDYVEAKRDTGVGKRIMGYDELDECYNDEKAILDFDSVDENSGSSRGSK